MKARVFSMCALLILVLAGQARADQTQDEQAVRTLNNVFAEAFVKQDAVLRASVFAENATLVTPQGVFLVGRPAMVKDFGPEARALATKNTKLKFSCYRFRFITPDIAFVDAILTVNNILGPDGKVKAQAFISTTQSVVRQGDTWLIQDERAHFLPSMSGACL
jgi:uncharacterized protein (TIGR02246 family)